MKNITTTEYSNWVTNSKLALEKKTKWTPPITEDFLDHTLPILGSIPLIRNETGKLDTSLIIQAISNDNIIDTPNGPMSGNNIRQLISFLYRQPRGTLVKGAQTKKPILASLTPLVLYANKLYNNIAYSEWDKESKYMAAFLGYALQPILKITKDPVIDNINDLREQALTFVSGTKAGTKADLTTYKMNIKSLTPGGPVYPKIALFMYLQIWLANAQFRYPESMILDPLNWDNVPDLLDAAIAQLQPKAATSATDYLDF